jgi:hypothetical protein
MERKGWRTVRAVVELPVQGTYSEKDLRWAVLFCLDERMGQVNRRRSADDSKFGLHRVKEFSRFIKAKRKEDH